MRLKTMLFICLASFVKVMQVNLFEFYFHWISINSLQRYTILSSFTNYVKIFCTNKSGCKA